MNAIPVLQTYFLDASAIVKLLINEPGSRRVRELLQLSGGMLHTSWVLIAEAMGVLKRYWLKKRIDDRQYDRAIYELFSLIRHGHLDPVDLSVHQGRPRLVTYGFNFVEIRKKYPQLDAADALQFSAIQEGYLSHLRGEGRARLVTADRELYKALIAEGIPADLVNDD